MRSKLVRRHECATSECRRYGAKSPGGKNVQLVNVDGTEPSRQGERIDELGGRKWTGGLYTIGVMK